MRRLDRFDPPRYADEQSDADVLRQLTTERRVATQKIADAADEANRTAEAAATARTVLTPVERDVAAFALMGVKRPAEQTESAETGLQELLQGATANHAVDSWKIPMPRGNSSPADQSAPAQETSPIRVA